MVVSLRGTQTIGASGIFTGQEVSMAAASAIGYTSDKLNFTDSTEHTKHGFVSDLAYAINKVAHDHSQYAEQPTREQSPPQDRTPPQRGR